MNKLVITISSIAGVATVGGVVGSYYFSTQNTTTLEEQFKYALISLEDNGNPLLLEKLKVLKDNRVNSNNEKLIAAKSKADGSSNSGLEELKLACQEIYNSKFSSRESGNFKDFQAYCSKNIKDQLTKEKWASDDSSFQWNAKKEALKGANKALVPNLKAIARKNNINDEELKNWCKGVENLVFEGLQNLTYKNAEEFCTKP